MEKETRTVTASCHSGHVCTETITLPEGKAITICPMCGQNTNFLEESGLCPLCHEGIGEGEFF